MNGAISTYQWCLGLRESILAWLGTLYDYPGQLRSSSAGAQLQPSARTGLFASTFGMKIIYQINAIDQLDPHVCEGWIKHVQSFQNADTGFFEDAAILDVADRVKVWRWRTPIRRYNEPLRRAETRQAAAALLGFGSKPLYAVHAIPTTPQQVTAYLDSMTWETHPWGAGSHTSHLVFFLKLNADHFGQQAQFDSLLPIILDYLDELQDPRTGVWHRSIRKPIARHQMVNGAMKVLTLYDLLRRPFRHAEQLIDLTLGHMDTRSACNSVDAIYVLRQCAQLTDYRHDEIQDYAKRLLGMIAQHHRTDGAFSFFPTHAKETYYGVPISCGLQESDLHGTHLLTWAIALSAELLGFSDDLNWRMPVT